MKCQICGQGEVTEHARERVFEIGRTVYAATLRYSTCDVCKFDYTTQGQALENRRAIRIAKVNQDGEFKTDF